MTKTLDFTEVRRRRRWPRRLLWLVVVLALLATVAFAGAGWYYSSQLLAVPDFTTSPYDLEVGEVDGEQLVLEGDGFGTRFPGRYGIEYVDGFALVGDITEDTACCVTRPLLATLDGAPPSPGAPVRMTAYAATTDPASVGVEAEQLTMSGPIGDYPGWYAQAGDEDDATVAIFVHGRGVELREGFRILPTLLENGLSSYVISYRNDASGPQTEDGYGRLGYDEWVDLEAWVRTAVQRGAERVVLVGYSQGGSVISMFLRHSDERERVDAVILDSPVLDWQSTLELQAANRGLPEPTIGPILFFGKMWSRVRAGIDFGEMDHVSRAPADYAGIPVLVFHGTEDTATPADVSSRFARLLGDEDVTLVINEGVEHIRSWNLDPDAYGSQVSAFLSERVR